MSSRRINWDSDGAYVVGLSNYMSGPAISAKLKKQGILTSARAVQRFCAGKKLVGPVKNRVEPGHDPRTVLRSGRQTLEDVAILALPPRADWWQPCLQSVLKVECPDEGLAVIISDVHKPWADERALSIVLAYVRDVRPHTIILNGDIIDNYDLSDHIKVPGRSRGGIQAELDAARPFVLELRKYCKRLIWVAGNHENRTWKRILDQPGFHGLRALSFSRMAELPEDILVVPYGTSILWGDTLVDHGNITAKDVAGTALRRFASQVVVGHAHRSGTAQMTHPITKERMYAVAQGTFCAFEPVDFTAKQPWNHGWADIISWRDAYGRRRTRPVQREIEGYSIVIGGKVYRG